MTEPIGPEATRVDSEHQLTSFGFAPNPDEETISLYLQRSCDTKQFRCDMTYHGAVDYATALLMHAHRLRVLSKQGSEDK